MSSLYRFNQSQFRNGLPGLVMLVLVILLAGCQAGGAGTPAVSSPAAATAVQMPTGVVLPASPTPLPPTLAPTPVPRIWLADYLPPAITESFVLPPGFQMTSEREAAQVRLEVGSDTAAANWVYALAAPFPTIRDDISLTDLQAIWRGAAPVGLETISFVLVEDIRALFAALWGEPGAGVVEVLPRAQLVERAWEIRTAWTLLPFEALEPRWKVLSVDGSSPLWKTFDPEIYPLSVGFAWSGEPELVSYLNRTVWQGKQPLTNRDPQKLTTVVMTGVTALVRATAFTMHRNGITYPGQDVGPILREADFAHVSNEIPFTEDCPPADPSQAGLVFCTRPEYIGLLEDIGTDVVELTGDHFGDWGPEAMLYTLELYKERGWIVYGGGANREEARQAQLIEHNGNKLAFIGCNAKGGGYATASESRPGAVACDFEWMHGEITRLKAEGYQVISTFQHFEYYSYAAQPNQIADSEGMSQAGAAIVSGSQAHQPQAMEFYQGGFIHYGLGNLFFDQYYMGVPTSQGFLDRHVFYDGRYLSTELIGIYFVDYARPRLMTAEERVELLEAVFKASGW
ncbi:MAG TPA: CapA family protein [Anaerolineales bacterium]|nr:CapA family protein [Anaerolineales bacterium]